MTCLILEFRKVRSDHHEQRRLIHTLDTEALRPPRTRKIFAIGHAVRERLNYFNNLGMPRSCIKPPP